MNSHARSTLAVAKGQYNTSISMKCWLAFSLVLRLIVLLGIKEGRYSYGNKKENKG
jgi:hypothetical protein